MWCLDDIFRLLYFCLPNQASKFSFIPVQAVGFIEVFLLTTRSPAFRLYYQLLKNYIQPPCLIVTATQVVAAVAICGPHQPQLACKSTYLGKYYYFNTAIYCSRSSYTELQAKVEIPCQPKYGNRVEILDIFLCMYSSILVLRTGLFVKIIGVTLHLYF